MRVAVLSTGRQDWGILRSMCEDLRRGEGHELVLLAGGMACEASFGEVASTMEADGFEPVRLPWLRTSEPSDSAWAQSGRALHDLGDALLRIRPDALVLAGDRFETLAAATAATLTRIPIVHLHGGEETQGAFDDNLRNAITKLAHLHLVSHETHALRVRAMGEDPSTVFVVGAPGLDNLWRADLATKADLSAWLRIELREPVVVVTLHPTTYGDPKAEVAAVIESMNRVDATYVITLPNNDPGNAVVRDALVAAADAPRRVAVDALGDMRYWGLLKVADAMLGNSSSALIEAPVVGLPAVNVGDRQKGRIRGANVLDAAVDVNQITAALHRALEPQFREQAKRAPSPFGDGHAAPKIRRTLSTWTPPNPPLKRLYIPSGAA
jgi:UDP-hydrolysing UDP-N-acetyl-D-glucosamine 2-epimerase